jgi:hypothetical protein
MVGTYQVHNKWCVDANGCVSIAPEDVKQLVHEIMRENPHIGLVKFVPCDDPLKLQILVFNTADAAL